MRASGVPVCDALLNLQSSTLNASVLAIIKRLFPSWNSVEVADLTVSRISGALTNCVFVVSHSLDVSSPVPQMDNSTNCIPVNSSLNTDNHVTRNSDNLTSLNNDDLAPHSNQLLLRVYGASSDAFIHRHRELYWITKLSSMGIGPRLLGAFQNGRFEQFLPSITLRKTHLRDPTFMHLIASEMACIHLMVEEEARLERVEKKLRIATVGTAPAADELTDSSDTMECIPPECIPPLSTEVSASTTDLLKGDDIPSLTSPEEEELGAYDAMQGEMQSELWETLDKWHALAEKSLSKLLATLPQTHPHYSTLSSLNLPQLKQEINHLRQHLAANFPSPIVFSHNDTQYGNLLFTDDNRLIIVDYEYASLNYRGFDIGDHWMEWCADYHGPHPEDMDWSKYPDLSARTSWATSYLAASKNIPPSAVDIASVKALVNEADAYAVVTHIFWGLWGIIQATGSQIEFDYLRYARNRIDEYRRVSSTL